MKKIAVSLVLASAMALAAASHVAAEHKEKKPKKLPPHPKNLRKKRR